MGTRTTIAPIRVGDRVQVIEPDFFIRCGYPMGFAEEAERVREKERPAIEAFLKSQGVRLPTGLYEGELAAVRKIAEAVAYQLCRQAGFGGKQRKIHTRRVPEYAEALFTVRRVRFVKTGTYTTGGVSQEGDYDPNYLSNEKSHRILDTGLLAPEEWPKWAGYSLEIEAANVRRVSE